MLGKIFLFLNYKVNDVHSRWNHLRRHLRNFFPHLTPLKIVNLILNLFEKHFRIANLKSQPLYLKIDPGPFCQLRCPKCFHRDPNFNRQFKLEDNLSKKNLSKIIEPLKKTLIGVSLSHRGEPFLNQNLIEFIEYIHKKNIAVSFPTNFSVQLKNDKIERLAKSGLDALYVSLDGASEENYIKYRIGGNFNLILKNVKLLSEFKKKLGVSRPKIIWKFIIFDHNKHEIDIVKRNYKNYGFDSYEFVSNPTILAVDKRRSEIIKKKRNCHHLWHMIVIQSDGRINPCCNGKDYIIGNAFKTSILKLWNSDRYKEIRSGFKKKNYPKEMHPFCKKCYGIQELS